MTIFLINMAAQFRRGCIGTVLTSRSTSNGGQFVRTTSPAMGDGARNLTLEVSRRKAYTSASRGVSTGDFTKTVSAPGAFNPAVYDSQFTTGQGGLPIKVGGDTIGGIGAAGAPGGDKDEACALAGLDKIKVRLN